MLDAVRGDSRAGSEYSDDESDGEEFDIGDACRVISVDGESGLGKSRLLREVRAVHANRVVYNRGSRRRGVSIQTLRRLAVYNKQICSL